MLPLWLYQRVYNPGRAGENPLFVALPTATAWYLFLAQQAVRFFSGIIGQQALYRLTNLRILFAGGGVSSAFITMNLKKQQPVADRDAVSVLFRNRTFNEASYKPGKDQGEEAQGGNESGSKQNNSASSEESNSTQENLVEGIGVFRDDKLVGYLNREETEGCLLISRQITKGEMAIAVEHDNQLFTYFLFKSKSKIKPLVNNGRISYQVIIQTAGGVNDQPGFTLGVKEIRELETAVGEQLKAKHWPL